jgi:uncharacterized protein YjiS (DUF1127 family)
MSNLTMTHFASARTNTGRSVGIGHLANAISAMFRAWTTRRDLSDLSPRELEDIGLTRQAALAESRRLPWDLTPTMRRF